MPVDRIISVDLDAAYFTRGILEVSPEPNLREETPRFLPDFPTYNFAGSNKQSPRQTQHPKNSTQKTPKPPQKTEVSYPNSEIKGMNCMSAKSKRVET